MAGADHGGFVHDDDRAGFEPFPAFEGTEERRDRERRDVGGGREFVDGPSGERGTDDRHVGAPPGLNGGGERSGFPGSGGGDDEFDPAGRSGERGDEFALLVGEARRPIEHALEVGVVDGDRVGARRSRAGVGEDVAFDVEKFTGRVAPSGDAATLDRTERNETRVEHEVVGEPLDAFDGCAVGDLVANTLQHLEPVERRSFRGETTRGCAERDGERLGGRADTTGGLFGGRLGETFGQVSGGETSCDRFFGPARA